MDEARAREMLAAGYEPRTINAQRLRDGGVVLIDSNRVLRAMLAFAAEAVAAEREACAKIVEEGHEERSGNPERAYLAPRRLGSLTGLAFADAIRARGDSAPPTGTIDAPK